MLAAPGKRNSIDSAWEDKVLVAELSTRYQVTEETIRRDLEKLEKEGFVKKTYGGAVLNKNKVQSTSPLKIVKRQTGRF